MAVEHLDQEGFDPPAGSPNEPQQEASVDFTRGDAPGCPSVRAGHQSRDLSPEWLLQECAPQSPGASKSIESHHISIILIHFVSLSGLQISESIVVQAIPAEHRHPAAVSSLLKSSLVKYGHKSIISHRSGTELLSN